MLNDAPKDKTKYQKEACSLNLRGKYPDAARIYELIRRETIKVRTHGARGGKLPVKLGHGEADAIRLFFHMKADLLLTDDGKAIRACRILNIPFTISPRIVLDLHRKHEISDEKAVLAIERLRIAGRYAPDIIAEVLLKMQQERSDE